MTKNCCIFHATGNHCNFVDEVLVRVYDRSLRFYSNQKDISDKISDDIPNIYQIRSLRIYQIISI